MRTLSTGERTAIVMMKRFAVFAVLCIVGSAHADTVLYVDAHATGPSHDGSAWCHAYTDLYEALGVATEGTTIRVADGMYKPDVGSVFDPRDATFGLVNAVRIEGGYAGCGAPDPDERDIDLYETILSGDLNGDDGPDFANNDENVLRVVTASGVDETAVLDGFTISGGNADDPSFGLNRGGGMFIDSGTPTLSNCTFRRNSASLNGGGMYNYSGDPTLTNCTFSGNSADERGGGMYNSSSGSATLANCTFSGNSASDAGGGMYNFWGTPTLTNCIFSENTASGQYHEDGGGGMYNYLGTPTLTNCTFSGNSADERGAGMYNRGTATLTDCTFTGNTAGGSGGGMYNHGSPSLTNCAFSGNTAYSGAGLSNSGDPTLTNCTFSGNAANGSGGGMSNSGGPTLTNCTFSGNSASSSGGGMYNSSSESATVTNCTFSGNSTDGSGGGMYDYHGSRSTVANGILWGNTDRGGRDESAQISNLGSATYTCIEGWMGSGIGNIGRDPLFVDPDGPDDLIGTPDDDLRLLPGSPAIDAGNNARVPADALDLDGDDDTSEPTPLDLSGSPRFLDDPLVNDWGRGDPPIVDMGAHESADCDGNGLADWDDIAAGRSDDCNENEAPDECEADCNQTGIPDDCDIAFGGTPDCNGNHVPDDCDLAEGSSTDCNENTVPDDCDIDERTSADCNENSIPDECDIAEGGSGDCNANGTPDECDPDGDGDGVINDCDQCPDTPPRLIVADDGCPVPYGPCCFADGPCIDNTESPDCDRVGGSYLGDGLTCDGDPDRDFTYGCDDGCPLDHNKIEPGICGCGVADDDADGDSVANCLDLCPDTEAGLPVNSCGCPAFGACCFAVGVCWDNVEPDDCATIEGVYQGDGSVCADGCGFGDTNADHHVDLADFAVFQRCFGSEAIALPDCSRLDADGCGTLELSDYMAFKNVLTGP